jgi:plasmid stabilization system protein ParE
VKVVWSRVAQRNVDNFTAYIARDKPEAAEEWLEDLFDLVGKLGDFLESGRWVPEVGSPHIREVIFNSYRVIYSVRKKVHVLTVRHVRQKLRPGEFDGV